MKQTFTQSLGAFSVGVIFAIGLGLAGMTQPQKIIAFLDLTSWSPALLFVMLGAVLVHTTAYHLIPKPTSPLFDSRWHLPTRNDLTSRLVIGSAIFGIGWGLGGFCPGPGIVALVSGDPRAFVFVLSMLVGMMAFPKTEHYWHLRK